MKYLLNLNILIIVSLSLVACGNDFADMEGAELRKRAYRCISEENATAAELQVCKNIRRECERRQDAGQFDC